MGVTGLWTVLQPCARPIKIETLNKRRIAVDASIWIYQFLKAVRDKEGNALRNSHIVGFFRRICKLLFIGIKPVFVFDGGAPALKRQTINHRKSRREGKRDDAVRTAGKLLAIQMQRAAEDEERKRKEVVKHPREEQEEELPENLVYAEEILQTQQERKQNRQFKKKDQYHLPDLGVPMSELGADDPRIMSLEELEDYARQFDRGEDINVYDFSKIDFDGIFFQSLPAVDRYNILNAARLRSRLRMGYSKDQLDAMFPDRMAFSKFQIERVRERSNLTQRLMNLNGMNDDTTFGANRIAGDKDREYVLVKNEGVEGGWALGVVTNKDEGKAHKPIDVDLPSRAAKIEEDWEDEEEFEDVPIEGLNRLPKGPSRETVEGREFISNELRKRRQNFYKSRKDRHTQSQLRRAAPVREESDSLFLAEGNEEEQWENVLADGEDDLFEAPGDNAEDEQLQQAIALSMQQHGEEEMEEGPEERPALEEYQQKRVDESNPFKAAKGYRGLAIGRLANQRANRLAPKGPFEGSDSEGDDMDLQAALTESRQSKRSTKQQQPAAPPAKTNASSRTAQSNDTAIRSHGFDGPLPFEKLNLGSSLLGKKKMDKIEQDTGGGFEKNTAEKRESVPLPPWFKGERDIGKELDKYRNEEKRVWEEDRKEDEQFQFQQLPRLRKHRTGEVIDLEADSSHNQKKQVVAPDSQGEDDLEMEDVPINNSQSEKLVEDGQLRMGDLQDKARAEPPKSLPADRRVPPAQDPKLIKSTPFADNSDEEPFDWSESEPEDERQPLQKAQPTATEEDPSLSRSPSPEFEDVPMITEFAPAPAVEAPKSPSPEFEDDVPIPALTRRHRREPSPDMLQGPDDLEIPVVPHSGLADDNAPLDLPGNDSDQYSDPEDEDLFASLAAEAEEHNRFAQEINTAAARVDFETELKQLRAQQKKDRRDADEVTQTMISECQHLLSLFGLPYVTAPMEAEAQCAELVHLGLVDGIVTDDSDTFLFGGTRVYKNMFNAAKFVECYIANDLTSEFSLTREKLIAIAQLLGSDYTTGIPGIGPVTALEIISEFPNLEDFRDWWNGVQNNTIPKEADAPNAFRRRFRKSQATKLFLPPGFPDPRVADAYLNPEVDSDPQPFQWGVPDLAALRAFLSAQIGWSSERTDEVLVPVIKDMNRREKEGTQANITRFFEGGVGAGAFAPRVRGSADGNGPSGKKRGKAAAGKRLGAALWRLAEREGARGGADDEGNEEAEQALGAAEGDIEPARTKKASQTKRKAPVSLAAMEEEPEDEEEDDGDAAFVEPRKKRAKRTRKARA
ncbi:PIN domain-like protein [Didymella exigua CBS 183.55]|uniref:PIN domain-like protein n=1 Tax=Didymella exigua CBS 183.55 TaxID=1150837 RepID=A0A6A5S2N5_9PLEO|nr:PIN domain-like protein [Didymella exigua CBS 183.55]KAF1934009.1 PIN domain-like protein [Didymella exigua CBS 183.55]